MLRRLALPALVLAAVASAAAGPAWAQGGRPYESRFDIPARPTPPRLVNDFTGTLSEGEREALERKLVAFADSAGGQVAVVLVPTTDGAAPVDYATEILREWGVGRAGVDDGVVLLVALDDREVFIATGYGAEGALTDATASTIVRSVLVPQFRQGNFYAGIDDATDAVLAALTGQFEAPARRGPAAGGGDGGISSALCCLLLVFIVLVVLSSRARPPSGGGGGSGPRRGRRRRSGPGIIVLPGFGGGFGGGGFGGGFGGGGFGGGGFGGFGGGFGGGGGAGGSW